MPLIDLTRGVHAIVDDEDESWASQFSWYALKGTLYAARARSAPASPRIVLMHREIAERAGLDLSGRTEVDHIDCNPLNNRRSNLRRANRNQNMRNMRRPSHNSSGVKGVSYYKRDGTWEASIHVNNRKIGLGRYSTIEEAASVYAEASIKLHGEYGRAG